MENELCIKGFSAIAEDEAMKKIIAFLIMIFCIFSPILAQDSNIESNIKIEFKGSVLGMVGTDSDSNIVWIDFSSQKVLEKKEIPAIISENPKSKKLLNKRKFDYFLGACLGSLGCAGIISSYFIQDEDAKTICSSLGSALCVSTVIPLFLGEYHYGKAISVYNMENLNLEEIK